MNKLPVKNFKIGIELEFNNAKVVTVNKKWKLVNEHCGSELKSPILKGYKGLLELRRQIKLFKNNNKQIGFANCGTHVHVDVRKMRIGEIKKLVFILNAVEPVIYSIVGPSRLKNTYCRPLNLTRTKLEELKLTIKFIKLVKFAGIRYYGLNLFAIQKHGTVEFRYLRGTLDWQLIYSMIVLYLKLIALAKSNCRAPRGINVNLSTLTLKDAIRVYSYAKRLFKKLGISKSVSRILLRELNNNVVLKQHQPLIKTDDIKLGLK